MATGRLQTQGYLAHKKPRAPRTLQSDYAQGPMVILGEGVFFCERSTPVHGTYAAPGSQLTSAFMSWGVGCMTGRGCIMPNARAGDNSAGPWWRASPSKNILKARWGVAKSYVLLYWKKRTWPSGLDRCRADRKQLQALSRFAKKTSFDRNFATTRKHRIVSRPKVPALYRGCK